MPRVIVDSTRLARVASWPAQWTPGGSASEVASEIGLSRPPDPLPRFEADVDGRQQREGHRPPAPGHRDRAGRQRRAEEHQRRSLRPRADDRDIPACDLPRPAARWRSSASAARPSLVEAMTTATIESFTVDSKPVRGVLERRMAPPGIAINTTTAVKQVERRQGRLTMTFRFKRAGLVRRHQPQRLPRRRAGALRPAGRREPHCRRGPPGSSAWRPPVRWPSPCLPRAVRCR